MKLFPQLQSCCRPRTTPPSDGGSHGPPLRPPTVAASQPLKRRRPHWQPALSSIMEDRLEDHHNNINIVVTKPPKKPSITLSSHDDHRITEKGKSMPIIMFSPFSMF